jgi:hypothetical protein
MFTFNPLEPSGKYMYHEADMHPEFFLGGGGGGGDPAATHNLCLI